VALVAALLIGLSFHAELESLLARYPSLQTTFEKQIQQASQEAHQPQVEPNPAGVPLNARSGAPVPEAQPLSVSSERHNALANELAEARRSLDAINLQLRLETAKGQAFEQQLARERERTAALTSELAEVRRDFDTRMTSSSKASEEAVQSARMQEAMTAALQRSFEEERSRSAALASELATARRDLGTRAASSSNAVDELAQLRKTTEGTTAELRQSLQQEREKVSALASELATARRDLETRAAASSNAVEELAQLRKTTEATTAELRQSLQQEREKVAALAPDLESTKRMSGALQSPGPTSSGENGQTKPVAAERPVTPAVQGDPEAVGLMARAKVLLAQGNIGAARIVLERAVEMGSAEASFALAETYDPRILSSWGTYGTRGDTSKARELYAKALAGGIQRAKDRFDALRQ
jgi:DNA repair exonuclease SbcCD ATPase subunit